MFWRKKSPAQVELTTDAYRRWLRALRPPDIRWFLSLSVIEQEHLAEVGEEQAQDWILALAYSIHDPEVAEAGLDAATNAESEEQLVATLARNFAARLGTPSISGMSQPGLPKVAPPPQSMGGFGERRAASEARQRSERVAGRSFLGRAPDEVTE